MGSDSVLVTAGEKLGRASEFKAGKGAYVDNITVYASLTGLRRIISPHPDSPDQRPTVEVTGHKSTWKYASLDINHLSDGHLEVCIPGEQHIRFHFCYLGKMTLILLNAAKSVQSLRESETVKQGKVLTWTTSVYASLTGLRRIISPPPDSPDQKNLMGPRWKGKGFKALGDPMSKIVQQLQSCLVRSNCEGMLCGCSVLLSVEQEQADLLRRSCFGEAMVTAEKDKQWFGLSLEEAFYLCHVLKCLKVVEGECSKSDDELWQCMKSRSVLFPYFYKAYCHLRMKNWVVLSGITYGADYVAYRHHPELVHSEYAVIVSSSKEESVANNRLRVWSDVHCATRLCGGVAKTLLVLDISRNGRGADSPLCLESYTVEERTITRWNPEQCREDHTTIVGENGAEAEI